MKIKLKLEQPEIICSGRKRIECYYKGKIIRETRKGDGYWVRFKYKGEEVTLLFNKETGKCIEEGYQDIIIK